MKNSAVVSTLLVIVFLFCGSAYSNFLEIQAIPTNGAIDWEHFEIGGETYLVVANYHNGSTGYIDSKIYKWNESFFEEYQAIRTSGAYDWESFTIGGETYLAVANYHRDGDFNIPSIIYKWDSTTTSFIEYQAIPTTSAVDWEHFEIGC